uniref:Uncharacterized protein n=1 Tax=Anopheles coluzzii TaxID=1518534 RepID=A0A8W7P5P5_ANOCL
MTSRRYTALAMKRVKGLRNSQDYPQSSAPAIGKIDTYATIPAAQTASGAYLGSLEATLPREMVSRRKILSRSRDDLNLDQSYITQEEEEDVWYQKEKLYKAICLRHDPVTVVDEKLAVQWRGSRLSITPTTVSGTVFKRLTASAVICRLVSRFCLETL